MSLASFPCQVRAVMAGPVLLLLLLPGAALASGGRIKLKTDNTAEGYYYNVLGTAAGRFVSLYHQGEFDYNATICGARISALDQSTITPGVDDYRLVVDLRRADPNFPQYALLNPPGLIVDADANSLSSCSTNGFFVTATFGGGAGIPDPRVDLFITAVQPGNVDPTDNVDFCGILLDTNSAFTNSARSQSVFPGGVKTTVGFNHFLELVVFEDDSFHDIRMSGSSRFPGDSGLPLLFARRACETASADCRSTREGRTTDDLITTTVVVDNRTPGPRALDLILEVDRGALNPALGVKDVTDRFRAVSDGHRIENPVVFPLGMTSLRLEIRSTVPARLLSLLPANVPFVSRLTDPNDPDLLIERTNVLGLRPNVGYFDDDENDSGFYAVARIPVVTGDAIETRFPAEDLPKPPVTWSVEGIQIVGAEIGAQEGLAGLPLVTLRRGDPVLPDLPDLSPSGLLRASGPVRLGPPPTTVNVDFTAFVRPFEAGEMTFPLWISALLNPGDTFTSATAIGIDSTSGLQTGNSFWAFGDAVPRLQNPEESWMMRLDFDGALAGNRRARRTASGAIRPARYFVPLERDDHDSR